jgi:hypothetical protein
MMSVILFMAAAKPAAAIPPAFHGDWVPLATNCKTFKPSENLDDALNVLTVRAKGMVSGESGGEVKAVRTVSATKIGVDSQYFYGNEPSWTETELLTLNAKGDRLIVQQTRKDGKRLAPNHPDAQPMELKKCR